MIQQIASIQKIASSVLVIFELVLGIVTLMVGDKYPKLRLVLGGLFLLFLIPLCILTVFPFEDIIPPTDSSPVSPTETQVVQPTPVLSSNDTSTPQTSPNTYRDQGFAQYHSGNYTGAISTFTACIQAYPSYGDCYHGLGMSYREVGKFQQSLDNHKAAISTNEDNYEYYSERCATYLRMKNYNYAIEDCNKCLQLNSGFGDCHNILGMAYRELGEFTKAMNYHDQAITLDSDRGDFYWERGLTRQKMDDAQQAEADFAKARELGYQP